MHTKSTVRLLSIAIASTLLAVPACDSTEAKKAEDKAEKTAEKAKDKAEKTADKAEAKVDKAVDKADDKPDDAADNDANTEKRFTLIDTESKEEFIKRAKGTIDELETELEAAKAANADTQATSDIQGTIAEARKDLDELENGTTKVIDDGKLGVTTAINSARRKLDRLEDK